MMLRQSKAHERQLEQYTDVLYVAELEQSKAYESKLAAMMLIDKARHMRELEQSKAYE